MVATNLMAIEHMLERLITTTCWSLADRPENACVHVIYSQWPRYSEQDPDQILLLGQYSKNQNILTDASAPRLPEFIFGPEPDHTWCYYYQKAELALQEGN